MTPPLHAVDLRAIDGRGSLGFLAALGLLNVLDRVGQGPVRLSFSDTDGTAVIQSDLASVDAIVSTLEAFVATSVMNTAIVGLDTRFPPEAGSGADPLRRSRTDYRQLVAETAAIDQTAAEVWLPHLVTDMAVDQKGRADITPFGAPSGKQNWRTFFEKPLGAVRDNPSHIREALEGWRRVDGFTGEYFDHRVINSAADDPLGRSAERGVPGATWLATMSLPLLRVTGDGTNVSATLWHRGGRRSYMLWPLWRQPLGVHAVQGLIEHPSLVPQLSSSELTVSRSDWETLGIFAMYGAERQRIPGRNFAGVLAPVGVGSQAETRGVRASGTAIAPAGGAQ